MRREALRLIISSKRFYVNTFRFAGTALLISLALNILFGLGLFYVYLNVPERRFYATNGVVPPVELTAMDAPNETSVPLLAAHPVDNQTNSKAIPK